MELGLIDYIPGNGRGNTGKFIFSELEQPAFGYARK